MMTIDQLMKSMANTDRRSLSNTVLELIRDDAYRFKTMTGDFKTIFDIGVNVGLFSLLARDKFPKARIVGIEAHKLIFLCAQKNLAAANVELHNLALGNGKVLRCYYDLHGTGCSQFSETGTGLDVQSMRLGDMVRKFGIDLKDTFLKIDCEGGELGLLDDPESKDIFNSVAKCVMEVHGITPTTPRIDKWKPFFESLTNMAFEIGPINKEGTFTAFLARR